MGVIDEFKDQVRLHSTKINDLFGQEPKVFRNTELVYSDGIGEIVASMGFKGMLADVTSELAINPRAK